MADSDLLDGRRQPCYTHFFAPREINWSGCRVSKRVHGAKSAKLVEGLEHHNTSPSPEVQALTVELEPGTCRSVELKDVGLALFNVEGEIYALDNTCPHAGGPLGEGILGEGLRLLSMAWVEI